MTDTFIEPGVVHTFGHLMLIKNELPPSTQLRFIAGTSLNGRFGDICIIYDRSTESVLVVPYFLKHSHVESDPLDIDESPESLALRLIAKEAVLRSSTVNVLGSPLTGKNSKDAGKKFQKFIVLITDFAPEDRVHIETTSAKNGTPFWVHRELLKYIFEEKVKIKNEEKSHPHLEAYLRFMEFFPVWSSLEKW